MSTDHGTGSATGLGVTAEAQYITVQGERFFHDRRSLLPIIHKIPKRDVMVEVGSLAGFSTRVFATYFKLVVSIDPYHAGYDAKDMNSVERRLSIARDLFSVRFVDDPRVRQLRVKSTEAYKHFDDGSLDFVYIDANHTYEGVTSDIQCWLSKVKPGGVIAGDDYDWEGVRQAVQDSLGDHEVISGRWLVQR